MLKLVRRVNWHRIKTSFTLYQLSYRVKIFPNQLFILDLQTLIFLNGYFVFFQRRLRSISWTFWRFYLSDVLHFHKRSNEEDFESEEKTENGLVLPMFEHLICTLRCKFLFYENCVLIEGFQNY